MTDTEIISDYLADKKLADFVCSSLEQSLGDLGLSKTLVDDLAVSVPKMNFEAFSAKYKDELYRDFTVHFLHDVAGELFSNEVIPHIKPAGTILDLGCGTGTLAELLQNSKKFEQIYGIDIHEYAEWQQPELAAIKFKVVPEANLPEYLKNLKPDAIILTWTLHHMEYDEQRRYAKMIHDALKSSSQLIILEDSYSETSEPKYGKKLHDLFMAWPIKKRQEIMAIQDWLANKVLAQRQNIPMPFGYRTLEEWEKLFSSVGFLITTKSYLGFPKDRDINNPQSLIILEKQ